MKYTVIWKPAAERELAQLWLNAPDRDAVASAADELDRLLSIDPLDQGESREEDLRVAFNGPLAVLFSVNEDDRKVTVIHLWHCNSRRRG